MKDFEKQIGDISPKDLNGYRRFMDLSRRQYEFAFSKKEKWEEVQCTIFGTH